MRNEVVVLTLHDFSRPSLKAHYSNSMTWWKQRSMNEYRTEK